MLHVKKASKLFSLYDKQQDEKEEISDGIYLFLYLIVSRMENIQLHLFIRR